MSGMWLAILLGVPVVCGIISYIIDTQSPDKAFAIGFLLGPLGIVIVMLFDLSSCEICGSRVSPAALICPGCHNKRVKIAEKEGNVIWPCRHCGAVVKNSARFAGRSFGCPACNNQITVPYRYFVGKRVTTPAKADSAPA